ncbi:hypothetical protein JR316_0004438 [Psilocybe cubensis]|uniref:Uncharacterized protein n=2 Tax=Psilocybe cubensis TaxID=181762 RepID=A0A8H7Y0C6_PSICU|nr:hypothetical protein JR316_0004438 [Psilocybe cubensis]KAH9482340.1 hypothetical protein JR316_0004438 [Psilocybe cubensis]
MAGVGDGSGELRPSISSCSSYSSPPGPSYISAHSADVILSDIRPIKLKVEALRAINALLDEFLSKILSTSCSLATDKLRAGLLTLLPTSLGKEALLEAEVELRAYWERTDVKVATEDDDSRTFHFEWAYELLRQKCEAYSTLNEEDEDPAAEARINEQFGKLHPHPPSNALLDPAALYLTAILEHILSNVGRVAARDSSRTFATVNDLFVALCEDDSIYGLFRLMKIYEQIELLSKTPKTRRSKSFSRSDRLSISRTSSPQHDLTSAKSRPSLEGQTSTTTPSSAAGSRTSVEKTRAIRMFTNGKSLGDIEAAPGGHKKSESLKSESLKSFPDNEGQNPAEDAAMLREFDDLMRSASTMKVSLTPDRLKTMEMYKQEKDQRSATRRPGTHFSSNSEPDIPPASRLNSQRQPLRHVDSIVEDDEEHSSPTPRTRKLSTTVPPVPPLSPVLPARARSISTSSALHAASRKPLRNPSLSAASSSFSQSDKASNMVQSRDMRYGKPSEGNGFPPRTRVRQRNRDSMDLDDVMNGSDDDHEPDVPVRQQPQSPPGARRVNAPPIKPAVSAKTRELMDFLAEGPPDSGPPPAHVSKNGRELMDFLADGPPDFGNNAATVDPFKPKGAGRLQRMISKLNLGNAEKIKTGSEAPKTPHSTTSPRTQQPPTPVRPNGIATKASMGSLANRPIPPRPAQLMQPPPPPISPPSSPHDSSDENKSMRNLPRKPHHDTSFSRDPSLHEKSISERASPVIQPASPIPQSPTPRPDSYSRSTPPMRMNGNGTARQDRVPKEVLSDAQPLVPVRTTSIPSPTRKPVPSVLSTGLPAIPEPDVRDMQRLLASATTADECRLIFDMYMARNGIPRVPKPSTVPYPSPSPSVVKHTPYVEEATVENSLVELFLGGMTGPEATSELPYSEDGVTDGMPIQNDGSIDANTLHHDIVSPGVSITPSPQTIPLRA